LIISLYLFMGEFMEPVAQTILGKSISSAVSLGAQSLGRKIQSSIFGKNEIGTVIFDNSHFDSLIEGDIEFINKEISKLDGNRKINFESICTFFKYPGIECVIRQIYAANLPSNTTHQENIKYIEKEFTLLLSQYFAIEEEKILGLSSLLFSILIEGCQETLNKQISNSEIAALAAMSNYHSKVILDELAGIIKNIEFLLKEEVNFEDIQRFFERYCNNLRSRHEWITISNFEGGIRKPIEKIYVCPNFMKRKKKNKYSESLEFFDFLSKAHRVVLLGDPGSGKTTFTKKICHELSSRYSDRLFAGREMVPFVVVVRDYHAEKKNSNISIIDFINEELNNDFQIKPPKGAFEYLLLNGYFLLVFDGLDELLDIRFREKMINEIESFCTLYPSIPIIVTSRRIGYEEAALREDMFEIYEIASFDGAQIQEYVEKWFSLDYDLKPNKRVEKAKRFMIESERVSDLRSNSLMLSLMCNIYKQENYIPENRPKIYQKCAEMLFKKWDRHRGINPEITIQDSRIESLISYLAHWIYTKEFSKEGVREEELISKATEYLYGSTYEDFDEAKKVAKEFVTFSKGRAWIFTAIGANTDQELYQFTHRTFLEYFTAEWFCKNYEETIELTNEMIPKISKREWDVVAQLAFQIRGEYSENATDKIFTTLLKVAKESKEVECGNLLSFAARSLEFMIPSPNVVKEITKNCFEFSLSLGKNIIKDMKLRKDCLPTTHYSEPPIRPILDLRCSIRENRTKVVETLKDLIINHIKNKRECEATLAAEIIFGLANIRYDEPLDKKEELYWSGISNAIFKECYQHNKSLFEEDLHLCLQSYEASTPRRIETVLKFHGLEGVLSEYSNYMCPDTRSYGIGYSLLDNVFPFEFYFRKTTFGSYTNKNVEETSENLRKIGEFCLEYPLAIKLKENPCTGIKPYKKILADMKLQTRLTDGDIKSHNRNSTLHNYSDPTAIFGAFCLLAILFELNNSPRESRTFIKFFINKVDTSPFKKIFFVWFGNLDYIEIGNELDIVGFTNRQKELIKNWAQKNIRFLRSKNKSLEDYGINTF
jgi:GTPase SAR1 family protein